MTADAASSSGSEAAFSSGAHGGSPAARSLGAAAGELRQALVHHAALAASRKIDDWVQRLDRVDEWAQGLDRAATARGPKAAALYHGLRGFVRGDNPVWAALRGSWSAASPLQRAAALAVMVGVALLAPVLALVLLLGVLIAALVVAIRRAGNPAS